KDQLPDRHASRIEAHYKRRDRARRHESARPFDVSDRLRQRLAHIRARMKEELDEADVLNRPRFDVLNARDVEKVIFVVRDKEAFHLRWIHAAIRLRDVDHRQVEIWKDVYGHALQREDRAERDANDSNK